MSGKNIIAIKTLKDEKVRYLNNYVGFEFQQELIKDKNSEAYKWVTKMVNNIAEYIEEIDEKLKELGADTTIV